MAQMSAMQTVQTWAGRQLVARAEQAARRKAGEAGSLLITFWNLLLTVAGLAAPTYGIYQLSHAAGWIAGGAALLILRSLVTWEKPEASRANRT